MEEERNKYVLPLCPFCGSGATEIREEGNIWTGGSYKYPISVTAYHLCEPASGQLPRRMKIQYYLGGARNEK